VFVSGCYDLLHAGHLQFFKDAKSLAYTLFPSSPLSEIPISPTLCVSFASEEVLWHHKGRRPSVPDSHKAEILGGLAVVDEVVVGTDRTPGLDFESWFLKNKPDLLVVTSDDKYGPSKRSLCALCGSRYVVLPKTPPAVLPVTGLCVWLSGPFPSLKLKSSGSWLVGLLAVLYTGPGSHDTPSRADDPRDYSKIEEAGRTCEEAVREEDCEKLGEGMRKSYEAQREEGMEEIPEVEGARAGKYCGGGWGGYVVYLFEDREGRRKGMERGEWIAVEPYCRLGGET
ncbi:hypothetical protein TrRE_jg12238, partial [Triparma retinervis]